MFHDADINKDGVLSFDELYALFSKINSDITKNDLITLMKEIDENNDGQLDVDEFIALMQMDPETLQTSGGSKAMLKLKKVKKLDPMIFVRQFKAMPTHVVRSVIHRYLLKGMLYTSSAFTPKLNPRTLIYEDLVPNPPPPKTMKPAEAEAYPPIKQVTPLISAEFTLSVATGVPFPPKEQFDRKQIIARKI